MASHVNGSWIAPSADKLTTCLRQRLVELARVLLEQGADQPLATGGLEQLHDAEAVGETSHQHLEPCRLTPARPARHAHEAAQPDRHRGAREHRGEGDLPRHREPDRDRDGSLNEETRDQ